MKILQINKFYYLKGGSERYLFELSDILEKNGHTVIPFVMHDPKNIPSKYEAYFPETVNLNKFSFKDFLKIFYNWDAVRKLERLIREEKPDVAHLHNIAYQLTPAIIKVLKKYNIPVAQTLHDYKLICPNYQLYNNGKICTHCQGGKYYRCAVKKCVKNSFAKSFLAMLEAYFNENKSNLVDVFIAPSRHMKKTCIDFGIPENKIKHLVYPIDQEKFKNNVKIQDSHLLYFGRLSQEKGLDTLIRAMALVSGNFSLEIVGDGPERGLLERLVEKNGLSERIKFSGSKNGDDLLKTISSASAVIIPSVWPENMPLSLLESMAMEKVMIVSNAGGMLERIVDGKNGFIFRAGDVQDLAVKIEALKNYDLDQIGKKAQEAVTDFNPQKHYEAIMEIYNNLVGLK